MELVSESWSDRISV